MSTGPGGMSTGRRTRRSPGPGHVLTDRPWGRLGDAITRSLTGWIPDQAGADRVYVRLAVFVVLAFGCYGAIRTVTLPDRVDVHDPAKFESAVRSELTAWAAVALLLLSVLCTWWACGAVARRVGSGSAIRSHRAARRWLRRIVVVAAVAPVAWTPFLLAIWPDDPPRDGLAGLAWGAGGWLALAWFLSFGTPIVLAIRALIDAGAGELFEHAGVELDKEPAPGEPRRDAPTHADHLGDRRYPGSDRHYPGTWADQQPVRRAGSPAVDRPAMDHPAAVPQARVRTARVAFWLMLPLVLIGLPLYVVVWISRSLIADGERFLSADVALALLAPLAIGYLVWALIGGVLAALRWRDARRSRFD